MRAQTDITVPANQVRVIGLVSTVHFFSHVYMLLLPPLLPMLRHVYGVGFTELGFALAAFSVTTGLTQAPVGFLVDRFGARGLLIGGLMLESLAIALIGVFPSYGALVGLMVLAGLANAVYHPADYAILSASVDKTRMGRAFATHTFAGYLGAAVAPVTMAFLTALTDWRTALIICALSGATVGVAMALNPDVLSDVSASRRERADTGASPSHGLKLLFSAPILMGLLFFAGLSVAGRGISDFSVSAINLEYGAALTQASVVLAIYLFMSPAGVLIGGWIADRSGRHNLITVACLAVMALAIFIVAAARLPLAAIAALFAVAGFFNGVVAPSRDMMIRAITPPSEMGKVFGFVSTGYNIGGIIAPAMFGYLLDNGNPASLFWTVGCVSLLTVATVILTHRASGR